MRLEILKENYLFLNYINFIFLYLLHFFYKKMNTKELKVNYKKLLNKAAQANGRKETVSYLNRAAKIKSKLYSTTKLNCLRCNGAGFLRVSLDETKTCLACYGKGYLIKEKHQL